MKLDKQVLKQIGFYLLYTFSITWLCWVIIIIGNRYFNAFLYAGPLFWVLYTIGSLGPAISSYIIYRQFNENFHEKSFVKFIFGMKLNVKAWLIFGSYFIWRFFMIWIAFGIQKPISMILLISMLINLLLIIPQGGLEELGWRGILQPRLEKVFAYFPSVLIVGVIWGIWHLPLWLIQGTVQSEFPFVLYLLSGIVLSFTFTTLYKYTKNIFLCVLSHAWFNVCIGLALYVGNNGVVQLNLNWKVSMVFLLELMVSLILGIIYNSKKTVDQYKCN